MTYACSVCGQEFLLPNSTFIKDFNFQHLKKTQHIIIFNNRKINLENLIRIFNEEEISPEDSGEAETEKNPEKVPCFLCGTRGNKPSICGMCNVVLCFDCWNDHDELLLRLESESLST